MTALNSATHVLLDSEGLRNHRDRVSKIIEQIIRYIFSFYFSQKHHI